MRSYRRTTNRLRLYAVLLMCGLTLGAARSTEMRPGVVWGDHLVPALNYVDEPTQQKRTYDYHQGEQATQEVGAIHRLPNRVVHRDPTGPEHTNRLDG